MWGRAVAVTLQTGDIVIVDNLLAAHGRLGWTPGVPRMMLLNHFELGYPVAELMDASETGRAKRQVDDASNSQGGVVVLALSSFAFYASLFLMRSAMFAAPWTGETAFGFEFKAALAAAQTVGYLVGKVPALALAPKLARSQLLSAMLAILWLAGGLIAASTALPPALAVVFVFLACVALSPCWYVLQRLIEGRSSTEAILSVLSLSVICGSGFAKSVGAALIARGHSDRQMVVFCAALGVGVGTAAALVVGAQPPPSASDIRLRGSRARIGSLRVECGQLLERYGVGIALSTAAYVLCGVLRALRDYFQAELLGAVGLGNSPANFVHSELLIACVVLAATACFARVPDSLRAVRWITATAALGGLLISTASAGWLAGRISGFAWIVGTGAGTFLAYVPMGRTPSASQPLSLRGR
ncbi:hypothetical protein T492DRAFT_917086 [Pavlovales sp. CCMP2436]|nr:hypothetical protein T492DRAFT_917086 [Pavlovales sp. CCMP2436]